MVSKILTILWKDLLSELRSKEITSAMLVFSLTVVVIFNFVYEPGSGQARESAPGILWVAFTFAGVLGLNRSFARELESGAIYGLLSTPVDRSLLFVAKMIGNIIFMLIIELITFPIFVVLFNLSIAGKLLNLSLVIFLGTIGFAAVGTLFSTIAANTKAREVMLPILLFPISVPVLLAAVKGTSQILNQSANWDKLLPWLKVLIGFDVIFIVACMMLYEYALEE